MALPVARWKGWRSTLSVAQLVPPTDSRPEEERVSERRRVAVTGVGAVTPIGIGRDGLWNGIRRERSAVATVTRFDPSIWRSHNAAEVNDFDPLDFFEAK